MSSLRRSIGMAALAALALIVPSARAADTRPTAPLPLAPNSARELAPGARPVLRSSDLGSERRSGPNARTLPSPAAGAAKTAGAHLIYYLPIYWTATAPTQDPTAGAASAIATADDYWSEASAGKVRVKLGATYAWTKVTLSSTEIAKCDLAAIYREVDKILDGGNDLTHVLVNMPANPACAWGDPDLEGWGTTSNGFGITYTQGLIVPGAAVISRAMMTNNWVPATDSLNCLDPSGHPVALSGDCDYGYFNDPWSPLSNQPYGHTGMPHPIESNLFRVLGDAHLQEITPGTSATVALQRLEPPTGGIEGAYFVMDGYVYMLEYRAATGLDAWIDDKTFTDTGGSTRTDPGGGVILTRTKLPDAKYIYNSGLVNLHPGTSFTSTDRHPGLEPGESYTAPDGVFALRVGAASSTSATVTVSFPGLDKIDRYAGSDRYGTSAQVSAETFGTGAPVAFLASGENFPDALSGAAVAGKLRGPVLLTKPGELPSAIASELARLKPAKIVALGGTDVVSDDVLDQAGAAGGTTDLDRWSGADRFATSAAISSGNYPAGSVETAYLASGLNFPDALTGAPVAGKTAGPVLLTDGANLPAAIGTELTRLAPRNLVVLGGKDVVPDAVASAAAAAAGGATVARWSGPDRFATAASVTSHAYSSGVGTLYIASGWNFPDALSGAPAAGATSNPVLLVSTTTIPSTVAAEVARLKPAKIVILGGPSVVGYAAEAALATYLP